MATESNSRLARAAPGLIRRVRREQDLSQRELADLLGMSQPVIARFETGETIPRADVLDSLLRMAGLRFTLGDPDGVDAAPMRADAARDRSHRQFPAHLDPRPYREFQDVWRFCWQGRRRRGIKVGYEHRPTRDRRRQRERCTPHDHPDIAALRRPRPEPRPPRELPPDCTCPMECERWCVQECNCQCEPIGLWGYSSFEDVPRRLPGDAAA